jgi:hypothetical protein
MGVKQMLIWAVVLYVAWFLWKRFTRRATPERNADGTQVVADQYRL